MFRSSRAPLAVLAVLLLLAAPGAAGAQPGSTAAPTPSVADVEPTEECVVADDRLAELSGLAVVGDVRYAVGDGGSRLQVLALRPDCSVLRVVTAVVDPYDVEDLAATPDGRLWLADIGDNSRRRTTVALHELSQDGEPQLHRMTYPDGPHDAEALLMSSDLVPHVVTKEAFGPASVYRPTGPLLGEEAVPLELVATVRLPRSDTEGGPLGSVGSSMVTGGAVSADGTVVALRTYTDVYLYPAPDGDVVAALGRTPVRVPLPGEPQGEAVAFTDDGTLLTASERADAGPQPIRAVPDAVSLVEQPDDAESGPSDAEPTTEPADGSTADAAPGGGDDGGSLGPGDLGRWGIAAVVVAGLLAVVAAAVTRLVARRRRRREARRA